MSGNHYQVFQSHSNRDEPFVRTPSAKSGRIAIRVFASSPGDVDAEREVLQEVVAAIQRTEGARHGFSIELFLWETHVVPKIGPAPQAVVDEQTPEYDIYLGIMSARYGGGGTIQEFQDALAKWRKNGSPWISFYFRDNLPAPREPAEVEDYLKVCKFRKQLESSGIVGAYDYVRGSKRGFYEQVREHLSKIIHELLPGRGEVEQRYDPGKYLRALREDTAYIDIKGIGAGRSRADRFSIDELYITLTSLAGGDDGHDFKHEKSQEKTEGRRDSDESQPAPRQRDLDLEVVLKQHDRLVVTGDPGAGKTTFLRRLAFTLCQLELGEVAHDRDLSTRLIDRPFPIFVRVSELTKHLQKPHADGTAPTSDDAPLWLPHFLAAKSVDNAWELDARFFQQQLADGRCTVLIDGLDEASDRPQRERISRLIQKLATAFKGCRFVVTSRPAAYSGAVVLSGFQEARIDPLSPDAVEQFLDKWCGAIEPDGKKRTEHRDDLLKSLRAVPEIRLMARNPVMLTALAVVHWNQNRLPEQRSELYDAIIVWLSRAREQRPGRLSAERTVELLRTLAMALQTDAEGRKTQVPQRWAAELLAPEFGAGNRTKDSIAQAQAFLAEEEVDSGIIVGRGDDVAYWHLTFQEYLAARAIAAEVDDRQQQILFAKPERLFQPEWREMLTLLAGCLRKDGKSKVDQLIKQLLDWLQQTGVPPTLANQARCVGLIGAMLRDLKPWNYETSDPRYAATLQSVMAIFDPARVGELTLSERIEAADALGQAGDPRLDRTRFDYWVQIPAGQFWMGASKDPSGRNYDPQAYHDESEVHPVDLSAYRIAKYPVTVGEYECFMLQEGYVDERFWSAGGYGRFAEPEHWDSQRLYKSRPVVGVSWYEARAFCAWAECDLPTEEQWERAARGTNGRRYPWGHEAPTKEQINFGGVVGHPTPVGVFPRGDSPEGLADMAGNVWEWCADTYLSYSSKRGRGPSPSKEGPFWAGRGGSWGFSARGCRSAYRYGVSPGLRLDDRGFRLALVPSRGG